MFIIRPTGFLTTLSYPRRKYMIRPAQVNKYWNGKNGRLFKPRFHNAEYVCEHSVAAGRSMQRIQGSHSRSSEKPWIKAREQ